MGEEDTTDLEVETTETEMEETETTEESEETEKEDGKQDERDLKKENARKFFQTRQENKGKKSQDEQPNISYFEGRKIEKELDTFFKKYEGIANDEEMEDILELAMEAKGKFKPEAVAVQYLSPERLIEYGRSQRDKIEETANRKSLGGNQKQKTGAEGDPGNIMNLSAAQIRANPNLLN